MDSHTMDITAILVQMAFAAELALQAGLDGDHCLVTEAITIHRQLEQQLPPALTHA
jgi:succinyl-CoA synthetase alpha subunit